MISANPELHSQPAAYLARASRLLIVGLLGVASCGPTHLRAPPPASVAPPASAPLGALRTDEAATEAAVPPSGPGADDDFALMRGEALGPVELGMNELALRRLVGEPKSRSARVLEGATGLYVETWDFASGLSTTMGARGESGPLRVRSAIVRRPSTFRTRRGVGVGASAGLVRARYAGGLDEASSDAEHLVAGSVYGGLIFELRAGTVESIFLGAAAE